MWHGRTVSNLVNDTLCNEICKDLFNETLDSLIENQFIKCNIISNRECLSLPKDSELHHRSIQSTQEDSSVHEHLNSCALLDSETNRKSFPFKEELEAFKAQVISEIKNLIHKEISVLKEAITTHSNIDVLSGKAQTEEFYQEQLRFMNGELRNKDNLIISLLHQLSKKAECITSVNNRFFNNVIDNNNNNNDNFNRKKNSYANENNNDNNNINNDSNNNHSNDNNNNNNNKKTIIIIIIIKSDNYIINSNCISTISYQINESNSNSNHGNHISSNNFNDNNNSLNKNSVSTNYDNISENISNHHNHDSSNISNNNSNHHNTSSSNFDNCNTSNHNSSISDNDSNNINCDNKDNNNKEQNNVSPNKHKRNTNSRVKHKTK